MSELSLFDAVGEGKTATQDYLDTLSRALLRHHQLVKAIRIYGRYVPESLPMPGLPVLVAVFNHTNVYALHQLPSSQIGQLVLSMVSFPGQTTHDVGVFEEIWNMGASSFTTDSGEFQAHRP
jgi:hypothetical protein